MFRLNFLIVSYNLYRSSQINMRNIIRSDISAVILSGGQSARMKHQDKGLVLFKGKPLISYVFETIQKQVSRVLISANRNLKAYQAFGEVITDNLPGFQGPLAGVHAALNKAKTQYLLVVPCDGPFISACLIDRLLESMQQSTVDICVATDGDKIHPTFTLIDTKLKDDLDDFLAQGNRKMGVWIKNNRAQEVDFSDCADMFVNLNTFKDFDTV